MIVYSPHASPGQSKGQNTPPAPARSLFLSPDFLTLYGATLFAAVALFLSTILPWHIRALGMSADHIGYIMGAWFAGTLAGMLPASRLIQHFGPRPVVLGGALLLASSYALMPSAESVACFIGLRLVQGLSWSGVLLGTITFVTLLTPKKTRTQGLGIHGAIFISSQAIGPWMAEFVVDGYGFTALFFLGVVLAASSSVMAFFLPAKQPEPHGQSSAAENIVTKCGLLLAVAFAVAVGFGCAMSFLADYVNRLGLPSVTGFFTGYIVVTLTIRFCFGAALDRIGASRLLLISSVAQASAFTVLMLANSSWHLITAGGLFGIAVAIYIPVLQALMIDRLSNRAKAITAYNFSFFMGATLASVFLGQVAERFGYGHVLWIVIGASWVGFFLLLVDAVLERPGKAPAPAQTPAPSP
ncbi:MAG: MFS transporter [Alphaproteobacteria bacterium]|nr:MFS transporter [Alphaproteobacteria bacterium]